MKRVANAGPQISVIVPVFNAESYLGECLGSICRQPGPTIEIITVDDASTDRSAELLGAANSQDPRVRIFRHECRRGPGAARNTGIEAAQGKYMLFSDSDDMLVPGALEILFTLAEQSGSDLVKGAYELVSRNTPPEVARWSSSRKGVLHTTLIESNLLQTIPGPHCSYLFRRRLLARYDIRYPTDLLLGEDLVFVARALIAARQVTLTPAVVYRYRQTKASLSRGALGPGALVSAIEQKKRIASLMRQHGLLDLAVRHLQRWNHQAHEYWPHMAKNLEATDCAEVFEAFRNAAPRGCVPWLEGTPKEYQYLYVLILTGRDEQAIEFLCSREFQVGFQDQERVNEAAELVASLRTNIE